MYFCCSACPFRPWNHHSPQPGSGGFRWNRLLLPLSIRGNSRCLGCKCGLQKRFLSGSDRTRLYRAFKIRISLKQPGKTEFPEPFSRLNLSPAVPFPDTQPVLYLHPEKDSSCLVLEDVPVLPRSGGLSVQCPPADLQKTSEYSPAPG